MIRVGRRIYNGKNFTDPVVEGFEPIIAMTKSTEYGSLGPYCLKDENGIIMENYWQGCKIYEHVPKSLDKDRYTGVIKWQHEAEQHTKKIDGKIILLPQYYEWRSKLFHCLYPIRYPVGFINRKKCIGAALPGEEHIILDYIDARKTIYVPTYERLVKLEPQFQDLKIKLSQGRNLLIIEVDGPHQEDLDYYIEKYDVADDWITNNSILATKENLEILLNDPKHPYGHGYCLANALLTQ